MDIKEVPPLEHHKLGIRGKLISDLPKTAGQGLKTPKQ